MKTPADNASADYIYQELLALRAKRGDDDAFEEIVRTFERPVFYYVRRLVESDEDAWDVLQQTWVKAFRGLGSLRETRRLRVWLYAIAHRTVMSHHRTAYRSQAVREEAFGSAAAVEPDAPPDPDDAERVHQALARLDPDFRAVLTLRFLEQLSVDETAEIIGVPSGTIKSRLFHAKKALKRISRGSVWASGPSAAWSPACWPRAWPGAGSCG
ncbi:MAG: RNA polymerase sigma factor [Verrucomicrobia bacterium]|nr:RNA polymerase sigma factor [Verrucomicrobiota bacterium]